MQEKAGGKEHHYGWKADVSFRASGPWIGFIVSLMMERCGAPSARGGVRSLLVSLAEEDASLMEGFAGGPLWLLGQRPLETLALCVLLQISKLHTHKHTHTYTHTHTHTHTIRALSTTAARGPHGWRHRPGASTSASLCHFAAAAESQIGSTTGHDKSRCVRVRVQVCMCVAAAAAAASAAATALVACLGVVQPRRASEERGRENAAAPRGGLWTNVALGRPPCSRPVHGEGLPGQGGERGSSPVAWRTLVLAKPIVQTAPDAWFSSLQQEASPASGRQCTFCVNPPSFPPQPCSSSPSPCPSRTWQSCVFSRSLLEEQNCLSFEPRGLPREAPLKPNTGWEKEAAGTRVPRPKRHSRPSSTK